jgi:hypothetical protein
MHRTALIAAAFVASACSFSAEKPAVEVEQSQSGLSFGGVVIENPDVERNEPTVLALGGFTGEVVEVLRPSKYQEELYEGAEIQVDVQESLHAEGFVINGRMEVTGVDGRFRGESTTERADPDYDCFLVMEMDVRGRAVNPNRFQMFVEQVVMVEGPECSMSELGPARTEEVAYRARFVTDSM